MGRNTREIKRGVSYFMAITLVLLAFSGGLWMPDTTTVKARETNQTASGTDAGYEEPEEDEATASQNTYQEENYKVSFTTDSTWDSGYNASITIENTGDSTIENWCIAFPLKQKISNIWNATIVETNYGYYQIKNSGWNQDIPAGQSRTFGITAGEAFTEYPEYYTLIGHEKQLKNEDYTVSYEITDDWGDGYKAQITITNNKAVPLEDWKISFDYGDRITKIWDAVILKSSDGHYEIGSETYNQNIMPGQSKTFGFLVEPGSSDADIKNIELKEYETTAKGKYLALIGDMAEDTNELELYMVSSEECIRYEIYASYDKKGYEKIAETDEHEYIHAMPDSFSNAEIYAVGYYGTTGKIESTRVQIELTNGKYKVTLPDTDGDGLTNCYELIYESDINQKDTDGDGLDDNYEVTKSGTNPIKKDTDDNEIEDGDEDYDKDGLTILEEKAHETEPFDEDTDRDGLKDGDEVKMHSTDPLKPDTDGDGLKDGDEIILGTDPLNPDTNGNKIPDGKEKYQQTYTHTVENDDCVIREVSISLEGTGCLQTNTEIESIMDKDLICSETVGLVGEPFDIMTTSEFDEAQITYTLDKEKLGETTFDSLMFLWYDEDNYEFIELDTTYNEEKGTVSVTTTHFSKYMIVDKEDWYDAWADDRKTGFTEYGKTYTYNTVLAIDCSGSMGTNDPIYTSKDVNSQYEAMYRKSCYRIDAASALIDHMSGDDKVAVVFFTSSSRLAVGLTGDRQTLRLALQQVKNSGLTSFDAAITESINAFGYEELSAENTKNQIVLLSDGKSDYTIDILEKARKKGITITTVGLGSQADNEALKKISDYTEGENYRAYTSESLVEIYSEIGLPSDIDKTDNDKDGLYDILETEGIRIQNGRVIYTDPKLRDSDGDGLEDGVEIDPKIRYSNIEWAKNGVVTKARGYYFAMISDPNEVDSDGDGAWDIEDAYPLRYNDTKSYIFNRTNAEWFLKHEANTRYLEIKHIKGEKVENIVTTSIEDFKAEWNRMGLNFNGKKEYIINEVHLIYHGGPKYVCIAKYGYLYADKTDNKKKDKPDSCKLQWYKSANGDISVEDLDQKNINYLNLSSCNNGNLDFNSNNGILGFEDNMAISFLKSKHSINKITAWDGSSSYDGVYIDFYGKEFVISHENSNRDLYFDEWSKIVNGHTREAKQQITYWKDSQGNIVHN